MKRFVWTEGADATDVLKGALAGAIGGLIGAWMMNRYHRFAGHLARSEDADEERKGGRQARGRAVGGRLPTIAEPKDRWASNQRSGGDDAQPATEKAAAAVLTGALGRTMTQSQQHRAGSAMHYAFGASAGGMYGALAELAPPPRAGFGSGYGLGLWLAADEVLVPALGLSRPPQRHPPSTHINALLAHVVYGVTLDAVRRMIRRFL